MLDRDRTARAGSAPKSGVMRLTPVDSASATGGRTEGSRMTNSHDGARNGLGRRRFLVLTGGALAGAACGSMGVPSDGGGPADGGPLDGGRSETDGGPGDAGVEPVWQLAEGHYEGYFPLHVIYPRPDDETQSYARHRHAYPGVRYEIPIGVQFGKWPYRYELIEGPEGARVVRE